MRELEVNELRRRCDPSRMPFDTTAELAARQGEPTPVLGQERAVAAIELAIGIDGPGYHAYALGPSDVDKDRTVRSFLEERAAAREVPPDRCYVHNFDDVHRPRLLELPPGRAGELREDMVELVEDISSALPAAFESEQYQERRQSLEDELRGRQAELFQRAQDRAKEGGLAALRTPTGVVFAPVRDGEVVSPDEFARLTQEEQARIESLVETMQLELQRSLRQLPAWQREVRGRLRELDREVTRFTVGPQLDQLRERYRSLPAVVAFLDAVENDIVIHAGEFLKRAGAAARSPQLDGEPEPFARYRVNVLVDHAASTGAPVIYEDNPTLQNLLGRIEHLPQMGTLVTDFRLIKPGSLHRANGGYLIVEAERLLREPFAWDALKRALLSGELKIEPLGHALSLLSTVAPEPEPVRLEVKVVLLGGRQLYYLLAAHDPDFSRLFKVAADFDERMERSGENELRLAEWIAAVAGQHALRPFDRGAVARVIDQAARTAGDSERLSTAVEPVGDLLREADHQAGRLGSDVVEAHHVEAAIDAAIYRVDRVRQRIEEEIGRGTFLLDTEGERGGQINGLATLRLGGFVFGKPSRITARVRKGKGEVVDIEREVKLGGPLHSKGVLILSSFLGARYAAERTLSLAASLVFEQSYGGIDGDSASVAELLALLSAIAEVPLRQSLAITGSVNQHGEVQAIGGVNEKVEAFFRVCDARGLTGQQGVVIPEANVKHLMLRHEVVEAVSQGRFRVAAVEHVDQAIELFCGLPAGDRDPEGRYPEGSFNHRVAARLAELAEKEKKEKSEKEKDKKRQDPEAKGGDGDAPTGPPGQGARATPTAPR